MAYMALGKHFCLGLMANYQIWDFPPDWKGCVFVCVYKLTGWIKLSTFVICRNSASWVCMHATLLSCVWLFATLWAIAYQAPLFMGFVRQKYWSGLPCTSPGDLLDSGIETTSLMSPALAGGFFTTWEALGCIGNIYSQSSSDCALKTYTFLCV